MYSTSAVSRTSNGKKTKTFSIIYGFEGKKKAETYYVYNILTGKTEKVSAEKFAESWNGYAVVMNTYVENITPHTTVDGKSSIIPKEADDRPGLVVKKKSIIISVFDSPWCNLSASVPAYDCQCNP